MTGQALQRRPTVPPGDGGLALQDPMAIGKVMQESGMFPDVKNAAAAAVKILAGQELGIGSVAAMSGIHIIDNKPVTGSNVMATLVRRHPRYEYRVLEHDDTKCSIAFFSKSGDGWIEEGVSTFTWDDAVRAGIVAKHNWKRHPKNMLFARALSDGVKFYAPDVTAGAPVYTPDELDVTIDEEVGEVAADLPPAALPDAVARDRKAKPTSKPPKQTTETISSGQQRVANKLAADAGLSDVQLKAIVQWVTGAEHADRIPTDKVNPFLEALRDPEPVLAVIHDAAVDGNADGHDVAKMLVARYLHSAKATDEPSDDGQQELG